MWWSIDLRLENTAFSDSDRWRQLILPQILKLIISRKKEIPGKQLLPLHKMADEGRGWLWSLSGRTANITEFSHLQNRAPINMTGQETRSNNLISWACTEYTESMESLTYKNHDYNSQCKRGISWGKDYLFAFKATSAEFIPKVVLSDELGFTKIALAHRTNTGATFFVNLFLPLS